MILRLKNGKSALIDEEDYNRVSKINWSISKARGHTKDYIRGYYNGNRVYLHRFIMNFPVGMSVDHINGNTFDNRKYNLRVCKNKENSKNRVVVQKNNTSGFVGVYGKENSWRAWIKINGKGKHIGTFKTKHEAAMVRDNYAKKYHKEFATLNFTS